MKKSISVLCFFPLCTQGIVEVLEISGYIGDGFQAENVNPLPFKCVLISYILHFISLLYLLL